MIVFKKRILERKKKEKRILAYIKRFFYLSRNRDSAFPISSHDTSSLPFVHPNLECSIYVITHPRFQGFFLYFFSTDGEKKKHSSIKDAEEAWRRSCVVTVFNTGNTMRKSSKLIILGIRQHVFI